MQEPGPDPSAESTGFYSWPPPMPQAGENANMVRMAADYPRSYAEAVEGGKQKIYVYRKPQDLPIIKSEVITLLTIPFRIRGRPLMLYRTIYL